MSYLTYVHCATIVSEPGVTVIGSFAEEGKRPTNAERGSRERHDLSRQRVEPIYSTEDKR